MLGAAVGAVAARGAGNKVLGMNYFAHFFHGFALVGVQRLEILHKRKIVCHLLDIAHAGQNHEYSVETRRKSYRVTCVAAAVKRVQNFFRVGRKIDERSALNRLHDYYWLKLVNNSNVKVLYRYSYSIEKADGRTEAEAKKFYSALKFKLDEVETQKYAKYYTVWHEFVGTEPEVLDLAVELPASVENNFQDSACKIAFKVEAVQGNAKVIDSDGESFGIADREGLKKALEEINSSEDTGAKDIILSEDIEYTDETLTIAKNDVTLNLGGNTLTITTADIDGIEVKNGASLTIEGGNGKLNINSGSGKPIRVSNKQSETTGKTTLTIKEVTIDIDNNAKTKTAVYAYAENGEHNVEVNIEDGTVINATGARNFCVVQLANNATLNVNGGVINASGMGSVFVAGRDNAGKDADDIVLNFNGGTVNITGGTVIGIECNYDATANINGGEINISGECDDSYAVGASFGGHIYVNDGAVINVKATAGKAYAVAAIYSGSTVVLAKGSVVNLGDSNFNGLADIMSTSVFIDNRE